MSAFYKTEFVNKTIEIEITEKDSQLIFLVWDKNKKNNLPIFSYYIKNKECNFCIPSLSFFEDELKYLAKLYLDFMDQIDNDLIIVAETLDQGYIFSSDTMKKFTIENKIKDFLFFVNAKGLNTSCLSSTQLGSYNRIMNFSRSNLKLNGDFMLHKNLLK